MHCEIEDDHSLDSATTSTNREAHKGSVESTNVFSKKTQSSTMKNYYRRPRSDSIGSVAPKNESSRIRCRYLHRLGVGSPKIAPTTTSLDPLKINKGNASVEVLKKDHGQSDESLSLRSPPLHAKASSVSFETSVKVHSIPSRKDYSNRVKKSLWMQPRELEESAARNYFEFQSEGWDWRRATEEQDFVRYENQLVHPAHVMRQCNLQRQFLMIMSAQQRHKQRFR